jgi:hypothetical protein
VKFLAASAFALIALTTAARPQGGTMYNSAGLPPPEYDRPYPGTLSVVRVGPELMGKMCPKTPFPITMGCAFHSTDECVIILLEERYIRRQGWTEEIVMRHERAHCLNWPSTHPGSRACNTESNCKLPATVRPSPPVVQPVIKYEVIDRKLATGEQKADPSYIPTPQQLFEFGLIRLRGLDPATQR